MNETMTCFSAAIESQFEAAIDMLERAIEACPDNLWRDDSRQPLFWYLVFHTLFWLDRYLSGDDKNFYPPAPFTLDEMNPDGDFPDHPYSSTELLEYLHYGRQKLARTIAALTIDRAREKHRFGWGEVTFAELLIYNLRHVQHGVGQLNLALRQVTDSAPKWVTTSP